MEVRPAFFGVHAEASAYNLNEDRCRFEHPPVNHNRPNENRFAALQASDNNTSSRNANGSQGGGKHGPYILESVSCPKGSEERQLPYSLDRNAIIADLQTERPQWILSAYGPGRQAPAQLFGGPIREQSFEEMHLSHYVAAMAGNPQQAVCLCFELFIIFLLITSRYKKRRLFFELQANRWRRRWATLTGP